MPTLHQVSTRSSVNTPRRIRQKKRVTSSKTTVIRGGGSGPSKVAPLPLPSSPSSLTGRSSLKSRINRVAPAPNHPKEDQSADHYLEETRKDYDKLISLLSRNDSSSQSSSSSRNDSSSRNGSLSESSSSSRNLNEELEVIEREMENQDLNEELEKLEREIKSQKGYSRSSRSSRSSHGGIRAMGTIKETNASCKKNISNAVTSIKRHKPKTQNIHGGWFCVGKNCGNVSSSSDRGNDSIVSSLPPPRLNNYVEPSSRSTGANNFFTLLRNLQKTIRVRTRTNMIETLKIYIPRNGNINNENRVNLLNFLTNIKEDHYTNHVDNKQAIRDLQMLCTTVGVHDACAWIRKFVKTEREKKKHSLLLFRNAFIELDKKGMSFPDLERYLENIYSIEEVGSNTEYINELLYKDIRYLKDRRMVSSKALGWLLHHIRYYK